MLHRVEDDIGRMCLYVNSFSQFSHWTWTVTVVLEKVFPIGGSIPSIQVRHFRPVQQALIHREFHTNCNCRHVQVRRTTLKESGHIDIKLDSRSKILYRCRRRAASASSTNGVLVASEIVLRMMNIRSVLSLSESWTPLWERRVHDVPVPVRKRHENRLCTFCKVDATALSNGANRRVHRVEVNRAVWSEQVS